MYESGECMTEKVIKPEDFQVFTFEDGEPMFYAKDVCDALGYGNTRDAILRHCKQSSVVKHDVATKFGNKPTNFIDEANVYRLIMSSKLPKAEAFQDWVCGVVLPSIRKTGKYEREDVAVTTVQNRVYRLNELREWLYNHGIYNSRTKGKKSYVPSRILLNSMHVMGLIYKDVKNRNWVATHYAIENKFCINVPVKQFVTFNREGTVSKTNTRYAFAMTETGVNEYAHELVRLSKKFRIQAATQTKLLPEQRK